MSTSWRGVVATVAAAGMVVLGLDYATFATTGDSLVLGRFNKAEAPTTLTNDGAGPALRLNSPDQKTPPMAVNSSRKVRTLNADQVDGFDASQLSTNVVTFTAGKRGDRFPDGLAIFDLPLDAGVYQASFKAGVMPSSGDPTAPVMVICGVADLKTLGPRTHVYTADSALFVGSSPAFLSGAETVRITDQVRPALICSTQTGQTDTAVPIKLFGPLKASFARAASRVNRTAQPVQPPAQLVPGSRALSFLGR